jgi:hypothetical protein
MYNSSVYGNRAGFGNGTANIAAIRFKDNCINNEMISAKKGAGPSD